MIFYHFRTRNPLMKDIKRSSNPYSTNPSSIWLYLSTNELTILVNNFLHKSTKTTEFPRSTFNSSLYDILSYDLCSQSSNIFANWTKDYEGWQIIVDKKMPRKTVQIVGKLCFTCDFFAKCIINIERIIEIWNEIKWKRNHTKFFCYIAYTYNARIL